MWSNYCSAGINGLLALMLESDEPAETNQFQGNMLAFNVCTIIAATMASVPWLFAFKFIYDRFTGAEEAQDSRVFMSVSRLTNDVVLLFLVVSEVLDAIRLDLISIYSCCQNLEIFCWRLVVHFSMICLNKFFFISINYKLSFSQPLS